VPDPQPNPPSLVTGGETVPDPQPNPPSLVTGGETALAGGSGHERCGHAFEEANRGPARVEAAVLEEVIMVEQRRRRSISATLLRELMNRQLADVRADSTALDVVDVGGGTGVLATELAALGHRVTVVDPSPDALASLVRRTADADADLRDRITARQGDAAALVTLLGAGSVDVVVCHRVLEVVDSASAALTAMATTLRPGGLLSLLVSQRQAIVLGQALLGHIEQARRSYAADSFDHDQILALVAAAGLVVREIHGVGAVADHVPESVIDADANAYNQLLALEHEISTDRVFQAIAPQLHVTAVRP
jgi:S-adenosylmethionine-dependent methyltransferase